ncbi:unnamed protein product [Thelazia callipaeda]|uniref:Uncharacterized protein n=1 Tax=Thelazia callipaeda TaxID=103827 RepID=A0A0N5CRB9_THECL|nr:unnamed protein product [Thelazia callipaeda]
MDMYGRKRRAWAERSVLSGLGLADLPLASPSIFRHLIFLVATPIARTTAAPIQEGDYLSTCTSRCLSVSAQLQPRHLNRYVSVVSFPGSVVNVSS